MRSHQSLIGRLAHAPLVRDPWKRRLTVLLIAAAFGLLALFPQRYRAIVSLTPTDPASLGLSGTLGQLGAVNSVFGDQTAVEVALKVAESPFVSERVSSRLNLPKRLGKSHQSTLRWLERNIDVRAMRGGIIQIETKLQNPALAKDLVAAYGEAVRQQLSAIAQNQTNYKRDILLSLVNSSHEQLDQAQTAYNSFRMRSHYGSPAAALAQGSSRVPLLQAMIEGKEGELAAASRFATSQNFTIQRLQAELASLQGQLQQAKSVEANSTSVGGIVAQSTEFDRLRQQLDIAQKLYDNYKIYLQGTYVEDLTSSANIRILEPAYIDPDRQYNFVPLGAMILILLLGLAIEFYNLRPPVGDSE